MNMLNQHIHQQFVRFEQECRQKRTQILRSNDIREIARIVDQTNPPSTIAFMKAQMTERRQLKMSAESRAKELANEIANNLRDEPPEGLHNLYRLCCGRLPAAAQVLHRALASKAASRNDIDPQPQKPTEPGL